MWCVASAPIVPLARNLDAALGMPRGELPFISASCPRHSPPPHSLLGLHPHFFRKVRCRFLAPPSLTRAAPKFPPQGVLPLSRPPFSISGCIRVFSTRCPAAFSQIHSSLGHTRVSSTHRPRRSDSRGQSPRLPAPAPRPARLHATPSAPPSQRRGPSSENTKKRAPFLGERCSFWVAKRSTFGRVVLTCATMGGHTGGKRVRRRGLACATCAVDLIDATLYFGIAAGESVFAHSAVAIDAAHHFAGGLFHTACGRLCGRGGRGRRRGGRARSRCGSARCGSSLGRRSCGGRRCGSRGRRRSCGGVGLATGLGTRCFARRGGGGFGVSVRCGSSFAGAFARSRLSAGARRSCRRTIDDDTVVLTGSRHTRRTIVATLAHEIHTSCGQQGHDHGGHPPFSTTRRGLWRRTGGLGHLSFRFGHGNFRILFRAEGDFAFELDHGKGF